MQEWMDEWVEGWRDGWLNGWRDGQIPGEKKQVSLFYALVFVTTSININLNTHSQLTANECTQSTFQTMPSP